MNEEEQQDITDEAPLAAGTKQTHDETTQDVDPSRGKSIVNGLLFQWRKLTSTRLPIDPGLELTLKLKRNYHLDVKASKSEIVNHPRCPIFPDSLWTDVLLR